ncbi:MAG: hypothetical protein QY322_02860 [bacterium]|nr:MAG: hypothetical protein QY322_02860 [bacterium]
MKVVFKFLHILVPVLLFIGTFLIYKNIYSEPRNWYDHYLYLTKSIIVGKVDIPDLPSFYHDKIEFEGRNYIPFPPGASFLLVPFVLLKNDITQQVVSILIGALNVSLIYFLLMHFTSRINSVLLSLFFAFGTVAFWSSIVGTTWFFAHTVAIFFILISLIFHFKKLHFISGVFFALAALTRIPIILAGLFFLLELLKQKKKLAIFLLGAFVFVPIYLGYNWMRFGNVFENGYKQVYQQYKDSSLKYSTGNNFGYFNIKNVPLHLYTFLVMPPDVKILDGNITDLKPSPFGMGIIFTSPLLLLVLWPKFKNKIERSSYLSAILCSLPGLLHYSQGWVQFGYRFVLDFIVFLMIVLSLRFKLNIFNLALIIISVIVNFWGVLWAIQLGW